MADVQELASSKEIADLFGVTTRRVEQLKTEGIIEGNGKPTKYEKWPTAKKYIKYLSDKAYGREKKEAIEDLERNKLDAEARIKKAKAEAAELDLKEMKGQLHRAEDVEAITTDSALFIRSMLMAMPGKLAVDCARCKTAAEVSEVIKHEVYHILENAADYRYDPEVYKKRVRERRGWDGDGRDDE